MQKKLNLKRNHELKSFKKIFSMSRSNFPERPSSYELKSDKPVLPEIENLRIKIGDGEFESLRAVLNRNADAFSRRILIAVTSSSTKSNWKKAPFPAGAVPRTTRHKLEACERYDSTIR